MEKMLERKSEIKPIRITNQKVKQIQSILQTQIDSFKTVLHSWDEITNLGSNVGNKLVNSKLFSEYFKTENHSPIINKKGGCSKSSILQFQQLSDQLEFENFNNTKKNFLDLVNQLSLFETNLRKMKSIHKKIEKLHLELINKNQLKLLKKRELLIQKKEQDVKRIKEEEEKRKKEEEKRKKEEEKRKKEEEKRKKEEERKKKEEEKRKRKEERKKKEVEKRKKEEEKRRKEKETEKKKEERKKEKRRRNSMVNYQMMGRQGRRITRGRGRGRGRGTERGKGRRITRGIARGRARGMNRVRKIETDRKTVKQYSLFGNHFEKYKKYKKQKQQTEQDQDLDLDLETDQEKQQLSAELKNFTVANPDKEIETKSTSTTKSITSSSSDNYSKQYQTILNTIVGTKTFTISHFSFCLQQILQMYEKEFIFKQVIVQQLLNQSDTDQLTITLSSWIMQPYINERKKIEIIEAIDYELKYN
ncbi:ensconsin isoform f [Anaeramoeba flamelloides]|uniref:Ensconsin isoform f n=1 Tax=Anaeramoeba flamelloides TaxID=1746091 RepID=A0AAV8ADF4_9EUKA|nr:ensconsin isoform f [Anaeramoeba flamelloides]